MNILDIRRFGNTILLEKHLNCTCSYCGGFKGKFKGWCGYEFPEIKAWNSWRVLWIRILGTRFYLRWTLRKTKG
ncbi:MAG: hypothetical protein M0P12_00470 [Paludibacteraceae bacterium]|nr:hypothetical protein [Paludibacteraceae bacterium]